ncbi:hypothetical protein Pelo_13244 [Pelomyxa schiedti]|nr:hypothetical protein Pelo_13244 [Pelomyxa schiedti]
MSKSTRSAPGSKGTTKKTVAAKKPPTVFNIDEVMDPDTEMWLIKYPASMKLEDLDKVSLLVDPSANKIPSQTLKLASEQTGSFRVTESILEEFEHYVNLFPNQQDNSMALGKPFAHEIVIQRQIDVHHAPAEKEKDAPTLVKLNGIKPCEMKARWKPPGAERNYTGCPPPPSVGKRPRKETAKPKASTTVGSAEQTAGQAPTQPASPNPKKRRIAKSSATPSASSSTQQASAVETPKTATSKPPAAPAKGPTSTSTPTSTASTHPTPSTQPQPPPSKPIAAQTKAKPAAPPPKAAPQSLNKTAPPASSTPSTTPATTTTTKPPATPSRTRASATKTKQTP